MSDTNAATEPKPAASSQQALEIQKIYIKDLSLEFPQSPKVFTEQWQKPQVDLQINANHNQLADSVYEVVLTLTITAKSGETTSYLVELQQAGIFTLRNFKDEQLASMLGAFCPNVLFPYARETVDSMLVRGGFPPLQLAPVNFDYIYQQQVQARKEKQAGTTQH